MTRRWSLPIVLSAIVWGCGEPDPYVKTSAQVEFEASRAAREERLKGAPRAPVVSLPRLEATTQGLRRTRVVADPRLAAQGGRTEDNLLWCSTFRMAWDALKTKVGNGRVSVEFPAGADRMGATVVDLLNDSAFLRDDVEPASCVVMAGRAKDGVMEAFREAVRLKSGRPMPGGEPGVSDPAGVVALSYMKRDLPFRVPLEPSPVALRFEGSDRRLLAFGIVPESTNPRKDDVLAQVRILAEEGTAADGRRPMAFVVSCEAEGSQEEIVLACIRPEGSLSDRWQAVLDLTARGQARGLRAEDTLRVPKMNFSLSHRFAELEGASVSWGESRGPLVEARQVIGFRLDEGGASVESHALVAVGGMPREYVFDRPFLLALRRKGAHPYFLMWIANDELLAGESDREPPADPPR